MKKYILQLLITLLFFASCAHVPNKQKQQGVAPGELVKVRYQLFIDNDHLVDESTESEPLVIIIGNGMLIDGFEKGILGMNVGETKAFLVPPSLAYGNVDDRLIQVIPKASGNGKEYSIGEIIGIKISGTTYPARIVKINDVSLLIDLNHPYAGKELKFRVTLLEKRLPTEREIEQFQFFGSHTLKKPEEKIKVQE